ncbi:(2Fe-2S)-binding protein [Sedimentibacter hydroxybenzoicus DSM 7310]|uniref:(2Fe-2S)-binding protein n=1 Tax=Sedimentibacter hydroxybenzoicus DSM 7310 TaxID=1123245 RepID=A0A974BLW4_SEDHY|nr:(2Fe-2S)-binding protein [Sedimentibacter hydroxybenzoicus]NYB74990.1 (2Fe-2S)-binding protein [Sedimentibacter hydroxybenzoicus DSM 7310]
MIKISDTSIIELDVNGEKRKVVAEPSDTLLYTLRTELNLTGAKPGCENGDCGACTVIVDGWSVKSCIVLTVEMIGHKITTIEGLKNAPIQKAFVEKWGFQCGFCTSGFIMVCHALAEQHPEADEYVTEEWLQSNLCRCTSYQEIKEAVTSILHP